MRGLCNEISEDGAKDFCEKARRWINGICSAGRYVSVSGSKRTGRKHVYSASKEILTAEEIRIQENEHEEENFNCNTDLQ